MEISKEEYFFFEWVILGKGMSEEEYKALTDKQKLGLEKEYKEFCKTLN